MHCRCHIAVSHFFVFIDVLMIFNKTTLPPWCHCFVQRDIDISTSVIFFLFFSTAFKYKRKLPTGKYHNLSCILCTLDKTKAAKKQRKKEGNIRKNSHNNNEKNLVLASVGPSIFLSHICCSKKWVDICAPGGQMHFVSFTKRATSSFCECHRCELHIVNIWWVRRWREGGERGEPYHRM